MLASVNDDVVEAEEFHLMLDKVSLKDIAYAYINKYQVISTYFLKGKIMGNHTPYLESCIVRNVVNERTARRVPVLTVFDSFIVAKQHKDLLKELMFGVGTSMNIAA